MTPSTGRIVHYVSHGSAHRSDGTQQYRAQCRAAIITEAFSEDCASIAVLNPTGLFFQTSAMRSDYDRLGGTWHWPERV